MNKPCSPTQAPWHRSRGANEAVTDADRFKLLFGPCKTPHFRYGKVIFCEFRPEAGLPPPARGGGKKRGPGGEALDREPARGYKGGKGERFNPIGVDPGWPAPGLGHAQGWQGTPNATLLRARRRARSRRLRRAGGPQQPVRRDSGRRLWCLYSPARPVGVGKTARSYLALLAASPHERARAESDRVANRGRYE
jgi:hypothetical protein